MKRFRFPALCALVLVPALALAACGNEIPGDSVVKVDDASIKKATFDHWMQIAATSQAGATATGSAAPKAQVPDSPSFAQCVAAKRKAAPKPAKGQPQTTDAQFKTQCRQEYEALRTQVLQFLIRSTWLDREAADKEIAVTDAEVRKQLDQARKAQFPKEEDFRKFLQQAGLTEADVLFQQRGQLLEQKITEQVTKDAGTVTDAEITKYYNDNKDKFAQPERRDVRIVLAKTQARARAAKDALDSGQSWSSVARRYSTDASTKNSGGKLAGVAEGQQEKALDEAMFKAERGAVVGPIRTQFGWYVFEVGKVTPGSQDSLADSKAAIKQQLTSEKQNKGLEDYGKDYRERWKGETSCREGYVVEDCENAPKPQTNTTTAPAPTTTTQP